MGKYPVELCSKLWSDALEHSGVKQVRQDGVSRPVFSNEKVFQAATHQEVVQRTVVEDFLVSLPGLFVVEFCQNGNGSGFVCDQPR